MKKLIVLGMIGSAMLFNAGCTPDEVAAGTIGVAVGVGVGIGASGGGYHHDHYHRPPPHYGRHGRWDEKQSVTLPTEGSIAVSVNDSDLDSGVSVFAAKYNVSEQAAAKISDAFAGVQAKGLDSFQTIGLSSSDLTAIVKRQTPSSSAIENMAAKLDMSAAQSRDLLVSMTREFDAQAADVNSDYWQSCMAKGSWKTAENLYCTSTSWTGCSPETGASVCY